MSEPKPDPTQRGGNPESSAKPIDGPDQQALSIIERAAREMATRRPRTFSPPPENFADTARPEPTQEPVKEIAKQFDEEIAKQPAKPVEEFVWPPEVKVAEEMKPPNVTWPVYEPVPAEDPATTDPAGIFKWVDPKPIDVSEPVAISTPVENFDPIAPRPAATTAPAATMPPAATIASARPIITPPLKPPAIRPMFDDHFHIALTSVQSVALAVAIFAFVIAAFGMAARGWVVAHDWSCRVGMSTNSCPPPPPPKSLGRAEIPS